jgi:hypothetical protein
MRDTVCEADAHVQTANLSATVVVDPVDAEGGQLPRACPLQKRSAIGLVARLHSFVVEAPIQSPNPLSSVLIL